MFSPQNILVPTDFSVYSDKALRMAVDIAEKYHSRVYVLHVIDKVVNQTAGDYYLPDEVVRRMEEEAVKHSQLMMEEEVARIKEDKPVDIILDVKRGAPCDEIIREQEDRNIELTIMPAHIKNNVWDHLFGTVAERVAKHAHTPVLMI